jgi:hypothetical protein
VAVCRACNEWLEGQVKDKATNTFLDLCPRCLLESNLARFKNIATTEDVNELLDTVSQMQKRNILLQKS